MVPQLTISKRLRAGSANTAYVETAVRIGPADLMAGLTLARTLREIMAAPAETPARSFEGR